MRTTLTIEDDIAIRIEERRRRAGQSLKQVVNALLREGLRSVQGMLAIRQYRTKAHAPRMFVPVPPLAEQRENGASDGSGH